MAGKVCHLNRQVVSMSVDPSIRGESCRLVRLDAVRLSINSCRRCLLLRPWALLCRLSKTNALKYKTGAMI